MPLEIAALAPHPPIIIPEIGGGERNKVAKTIESMEELARIFVDKELDVLVTISPHGPVFSDVISSLHVNPIRGSFAAFGHPEVSLTLELEETLSEKINREMEREKIPFRKLREEDCKRFRITPELDHGVLVPLYFLQEQGIDLPLVPLNMGLLTYAELIQAGNVLQRVFADYPARIGVIASGDLSHRLTKNAPAGYSPQGREFDEKVMEIIEGGNLLELKNLDPILVEKAGECGLRPLLILAGVLSGKPVKSQVLSYEGPFGVGYGVACFTEGSVAPPGLARKAVEAYLEKKEVIEPPAELPDLFKVMAGAFVSIKKLDGSLRGCIGTLEPTQKNLAQEIIRNAIQSAFKDPRFPPVSKMEMEELVFSVDVIHPPEPVESIADLDHKKYGVIVEKGGKRGVLLPDLEGINSVEEQVEIAKMKAGLGGTTDVFLKRFQVERYIQE